MDRDVLVSGCQEKLSYFRIKELKDVLSRLGIGKQGKKQVLRDRIMQVLSDDQGSRSQGWTNRNLLSKEEVATIIDDIHRKMQGSGAADLASKNRSSIRDVIQESETKVCCPCGISMQSENLIKCDENRCNLWQHQRCVIIPENGDGSLLDRPSSYYCCTCRINRGDPFSLTVAQPLPPTKLNASPIPVDGTNRLLTLEKSFELRRQEREYLQKSGYDLQVWCVLLNDQVPFRIHWPQYSDLRVNDVLIRATTRQPTQVLGLKARDDGPIITSYFKEGTNRITFRAQDNRQFVIGVRILRRRKSQEVRSLIPSESDGESFDVSVARVRHCVGSDDDGDLEVVAESQTVNLRCPLSSSRIKVAGRFKHCSHMSCFDLDTLIEFNQVARKWQCPTCMENYSVYDIIIDRYFNGIASCLQSYPEDVTEVELRPDASWRPKIEGDSGQNERWRQPDGSVIIPNGQMISQPLIVSKVKSEGATEGHLSSKIRMKRNREGMWEVSGATPSNPQDIIVGIDIRDPKTRRTTSSATATNRDDEDPSVNQEGSDAPEFSGSFDRFDSSHRYNPIPVINGNPGSSCHLKGPEVIDVIDSDDENMDDMNICSSNVSTFDTPRQGTSMISPQPLHEPPMHGSDISFMTPGAGSREISFPDMIPTDHSSHGFFINDNFGSWPLNPQNTELNFFATNAGIPETSHCPPLTSCDVPAFDFESNRPLDSTFGISNAEANGGFNNPVRVDDEDPQLQCFLSLEPTRSSIQTDCRNSFNACEEGLHISLTLGSGGNNLSTTCPDESAAACNFQQSAQDGDDLATASVLLNMSENRTEPCSGDEQGSESPFMTHQRPRVGRPRLCLPVDSDSD